MDNAQVAEPFVVALEVQPGNKAAAPPTPEQMCSGAFGLGALFYTLSALLQRQLHNLVWMIVSLVPPFLPPIVSYFGKKAILPRLAIPDEHLVAALDWLTTATANKTIRFPWKAAARPVWITGDGLYFKSMRRVRWSSIAGVHVSEHSKDAYTV